MEIPQSCTKPSICGDLYGQKYLRHLFRRIVDGSELCSFVVLIDHSITIIKMIQSKNVVSTSFVYKLIELIGKQPRQMLIRNDSFSIFIAMVLYKVCDNSTTSLVKTITCA